MTDVFDGDGVLAPGAEADEPFTVRLTVRKRGDTITADFTGSDGQVPGPMNAPLTVTASGVYCALKMIADPKSLIPPNSGCWRPVTVTAPPGSVVNAQLPAPVVYANHEISHRVADMVMAAMFQISPENVMAASQGTSAVVTFGGARPAQWRALCQLRVAEGRVWRTAGQGRHQRRRQHGQQHDEHAGRDARDELSASRRGICADPRLGRCRHLARRARRPPGVARARPRSACRGVLRAQPHTALRSCRRASRRPDAALARTCPTATRQPLNSKGAFTVPAGGRIVMEAPGSGGYGPPSARDPALLREDLADGYVIGGGGAARLWCRRLTRR